MLLRLFLFEVLLQLLLRSAVNDRRVLQVLLLLWHTLWPLLLMLLP
jgi:hypothetical protein